MSYEATGKVHLIAPTEKRGSFEFRRLVIEMADNPKYPQFVELQATRDNIVELDKFHVGDEIKVMFNLRGREWKSPSGDVKFFNTLDLWKVDMVKAAAPGAVATGSNEDLPF